MLAILLVSHSEGQTVDDDNDETEVQVIQGLSDVTDVTNDSAGLVFPDEEANPGLPSPSTIVPLSSSTSVANEGKGPPTSSSPSDTPLKSAFGTTTSVSPFKTTEQEHTSADQKNETPQPISKAAVVGIAFATTVLLCGLSLLWLWTRSKKRDKAKKGFSERRLEAASPSPSEKDFLSTPSVLSKNPFDQRETLVLSATPEKAAANPMMQGSELNGPESRDMCTHKSKYSDGKVSLAPDIKEPALLQAGSSTEESDESETATETDTDSDSDSDSGQEVNSAMSVTPQPQSLKSSMDKGEKKMPQVRKEVRFDLPILVGRKTGSLPRAFSDKTTSKEQRALASRKAAVARSRRIPHQALPPQIIQQKGVSMPFTTLPNYPSATFVDPSLPLMQYPLSFGYPDQMVR
jgi:hypothetical protein